MKITKICANNLGKVEKNNQIVQRQKLNNFSSVNLQNTPSFAYKQYALTFSGNEDKPSIVYEFDEEGNLVKITKFDQQCEIAAELYIDNKNKSVTVLEPNNKPRQINFENGKFVEV